MKKLSITIIFCLISTFAFATNYHVTQNGGSGTNPLSASEFNGLSGNKAGDKYYFSGAFTTRITTNNIYGTSGSPVVLDGYESGDISPITDCDAGDFTCDGNSASSAVLSHGIAIGGGSGTPDYITVQDFRMTHDSGTFSTVYILGDEGNYIDGFTFQRNFVYDSGTSMLDSTWTNYMTLTGNKFFVFNQVGGAPQGINLTRANDLVVRSNVFGHDEDNYPSNPVAFDNAEMMELHGCNRVLIEYNDIYGAPSQSGIRPKELASYVNQTDIIIRFNKIHGCLNQRGLGGTSAYGIHAHTGTNQAISGLYIYGNYIYNNINGIGIGQNISNVYVWANIISYNRLDGIVTWTLSDPGVNGLYVYNNTIANNDISEGTSFDNTGMGIQVGSNVNIKNNIVADNLKYGSKYFQIAAVSLSSLDYNTLFVTGNTATWYYDSGTRSLATMQGTYGLEVNGNVRDPLFADPNGADNTYGTADDDYRLQAGSSEIGDAQNLTQQFQVSVQGVTYTMNYDTGLDPTTDWIPFPSSSTVKTANKNNYQWDRGAYIYFSEAESPAPVITSSADGYTNDCPYGADPITANFWLYTDIPSYCKGGLKSTTCADDYPDGYADAGLTAYDGGGTTTHGLELSVACGSAHTVCAICSTVSGSGGSESGWTEITRTVDAEEGEPGTPGAPSGLTIHGDTSGHAQVTLHSDTSGHALTTPY